jgi:hypothetical protein
MLTRRRLMRPLVLLGDVMRVAGLEFGEHRVGGRQRLLCAQHQEARGKERGCVNPSDGRLLSESTPI